MKHTYLLFNSELGLIKIGVSKNLKCRFYTLPPGFTDITPVEGLDKSIEGAFKHYFKASSVPFEGIKNEVFTISPSEATDFLLKAQNAINNDPTHAPRWLSKYVNAKLRGLQRHQALWFLEH